ncbi:MAG: potassium channel family protein [Actinomycetota bacterium]
MAGRGWRWTVSRTGWRAGPIVRRVWYWALSVLALILVGTVGYMVLESWTFGDAIYMAVITLTTVGYREVNELDPAGRVWTMMFAIAGIGVLFGTVGVVAEAVLTEVTSGRREVRTMQKSVDTLQDHFIVCGYGRVGSMVARQLVADGYDVVVIDIRPESLEIAAADGLRTVAGDGTSDAVLVQAGIARARGLVSSIDSDANNVYVTLSARAMNPGLFIVARASAEGADLKLLQAGADRVVSPYTMAGRRIAELAVRPRVVEFIDAAMSHGELAFTMEEVEVRAGGKLDGRSVGELRADGIFTLAVVQEEGGYQANPHDDRILAVSEHVIVSGAAGLLRRLAEP